jgi:FMN phosphatase YigB (HAD superfamily)
MTTTRERQNTRPPIGQPVAVFSAPHEPVEGVLVDVGGTLWPNTWPLTEQDRLDRVTAMSAVFPSLSRASASDLVSSIVELVEEAAAADPGRSADALIADELSRRELSTDPVAVRAVRQALSTRLGSRATLPGAAELLSAIKAAHQRCVILSNTTYRDAEVYALDFADLGWSRWVDGCVTSVDVGCAKPDDRIFRAALDVIALPPHRCVMIGNSEAADIVPARNLGLRTIRVALEEPLPDASVADAVVDSLHAVVTVLRSWS